MYRKGACEYGVLLKRRWGEFGAKMSRVMVLVKHSLSDGGQTNEAYPLLS